MGSPTPSHGAFLGLLPPTDVEALHARGRLRRYRRGEWLMRQGDPATSVVVLLDGRAKIALDTTDGRTIILDVFGRGDLVGEFEALGDYPRHEANVIALDDMSCRSFSREEFRDFLIAQPTAALAVVHLMIHRLGAADRRRIDGTTVDAPRRLALFLLETAGGWGAPAGSSVAADVPLAQHELASLIGVSRNSLVRALTTLRSEGLVTTSAAVIRIPDPDALRRYVSP